MKTQNINVEIDFQLPSKTLEDYYRSRATATLIKGPLGSGKTQTSIMKCMSLMQEQTPNDEGVRPTRMLIIRNTYPDLITTTIRDWASITGKIAPIKMGHPPSQLIKYSLPDHTTVECDVLFVALDREEHVRKLRGSNATFAWFNETKELPFALLEMADARLGRYPSRALAGVDCDHAGMIIGDSNAPDEDHWYAKMEQDPPKGWQFFDQPGAVSKRPDGGWDVNQEADNIKNLPKGYYDKLINGKRESWIRVNLANEYGSSVDGKPIYDEFNNHIHVKEFEIDSLLPVYIGMDFGLTPAAVLFQMNDSQMRVFDEIVTSGMSATQIADAMSQRMAVKYPQLFVSHGWGDPAGVQGSQADKNTPFMVLAAKGFTVYPAHTNDPILRRDAVAGRLTTLTKFGEPSLIVHPRCTVLKKGMAGHYQYKRIKVAGDERYHDVPDKNMYSHVCEGLQYACVGVGDAMPLITSKHNANKPVNVPRHVRQKQQRQRVWGLTKR